MAANRARLEVAELPALATQSVTHWDDLLRHGHLGHHEDRTPFTIDSLSGDRYAVFVDLVESYFLAGYEYFTPIGLRAEDQERLNTQFGP